MKKIILLFVAIVSIANLVFGQEKTKPCPWAVAVLNPDMSGEVNNRERIFIRGYLENAFIQMRDKGYIVVNRNKIDAAIAEQKFTHEDFSNDAKRMGVFMGADLICITNIGKEDGTVFLDAKLMDVETGILLVSILPRDLEANDLPGGCKKAAQDLINELGECNNDGIEMVFVEGGAFMMGCTSEQSDCEGNEKPAREVTVKSFNIAKYEVTQALWEQIMGTNPSVFKGANLPIEKVSWDDVQVFLGKLNEATKKHYRLPTEAEWEYAARGGKKSEGNKYSGSNDLGNVGWFAENSAKKTHPVGTKSPNELGIHDMSGNVYEWCSDMYIDYNARVIRGGAWYIRKECCCISHRSHSGPHERHDSLGFRLVTDVSK
ncbi:MAG: formylglycine-generating enzyme family protein [Candidatus Symbiothrix sp.]|jgi:formylglycine-generating enzyme required for sulfatase activity|nr:formylglycine-generating enzyme family protein [Candidatus Symbiothrix sp.]